MRLEVSLLIHGDEPTYRDIELELDDGLSASEIVDHLTDELQTIVERHLEQAI